MDKPRRIKPQTVQVSMVGEPGEPEIPLGETKLEGWHDGQQAWITGVLHDRAGRIWARVSLDAIPLSALPAPKKGGRPTEAIKHKAVCLAWAIHYQATGGKGKADWVVATSFGYQDAKPVSDLRRPFEKAIQDWVITPAPNEKERLAVLIERPTIYHSDGMLTMLGMAWFWHAGMGKAAGHAIMKIESRLDGPLDDGFSTTFPRGPLLIVQC